MTPSSELAAVGAGKEDTIQGGKRMIIACIPAYNEEKNIAKVIVLAKKYVDKVVVCDDGSTDMTAEIAKSLGAQTISHERNMGYGATLSTLFKQSRIMGADIIVTIDGDGQHDPAAIPRLIQPIEAGEVDVVIGSRFLGNEGTDMPGYRQIGAKAITRLSNSMLSLGITDAQSGLRAYGRKAIELTAPSEMGMGASIEIVKKANDTGLRIKEIPATISYFEGSSTLNPAYHGLDVVLSSIKHMSMRHPLLFYGVPGFLFLLVAIGAGWLTIDTYVKTRELATNQALVALGAAVVSLILLALSVLLWVLISAIREQGYRDSSGQLISE